MDVNTMKNCHPPRRYELRYGDLQALHDLASNSLFDAFVAAYNYGFIRGQRAENGARRKSCHRRPSKEVTP